jgi:hypothetical protein
MKRLSAIFAATLVTTVLWAQSPEKMSYQAVLRDTDNELVVDTQIGMQISILQGSVSGEIVYSETHTPTSNTIGLVSLEIGSGTEVAGDFSAIDWSEGPYFIKTETDITGGANYSLTGTSQLLSVPYALYAKHVENSHWSGNGTGIDYKDGNVGIGTSFPQYKLDIQDSISTGNRTLLNIENKDISTTSSAALEVKAGSLSNYSVFRMHGDNYDYSWWGKHGQLKTVGDGLIIEATKADKSGGDIVFVNGSTGGDQNIKTINMKINGDGNVGIGTSFPQYKLDIQDSISTGNRTLLNIENKDISTTSSAALEVKAGSLSNYSVFRMHGDNYDYSWWGKHGQLKTVGDGLIIEATKADKSGGDIVFVNGSTGGDQNIKTINMKINGDGNVGIGTSFPQYKLDIQDSISTGNRTLLNIENKDISTTSSAALEVKAGSLSNYSVFRMHGDNYDYSWWGKHGQLKTVGDGLIIEATKADKSGGDIVFVNGSTGGDQNIKTINMKINGDGNVGIGTSFPQYKLDIQDSISTGNRTLLNIENKDISTTSSAALEVKAGSLSNYSVFRMHGDNYDYSWWGKHGQLKTVGDGLIIEATKADKSGGDIVFVNGSTGGDQNIKTINMKINGDGNVGIGTDAPQEKLQIKSGDIYLEDVNSGVILTQLENSNP